MNIHVRIKIQARREYPAELFHPIPCDERVFPYWIKKLFNNEFCSSRKCCAVVLKRKISSVENMPSVFGNKYRNFHWPEPQLLTNDPTVAWGYCFINNCFVIGWCEPWQYRLFQVSADCIDLMRIWRKFPILSYKLRYVFPHELYRF